MEKITQCQICQKLQKNKNSEIVIFLENFKLGKKAAKSCKKGQKAEKRCKKFGKSGKIWQKATKSIKKWEKWKK